MPRACVWTLPQVLLGRFCGRSSCLLMAQFHLFSSSREPLRLCDVVPADISPTCLQLRTSHGDWCPPCRVTPPRFCFPPACWPSLPAPSSPFSPSGSLLMPPVWRCMYPVLSPLDWGLLRVQLRLLEGRKQGQASQAQKML